ncbi:hypothetical protein ACWGIB_08280 [Streptomyces xiamenensis]
MSDSRITRRARYIKGSFVRLRQIAPPFDCSITVRENASDYFDLMREKSTSDPARIMFWENLYRCPRGVITSYIRCGDRKWEMADHITCVQGLDFVMESLNDVNEYILGLS